MSNQWSRTGNCQQKEWPLWWDDKPQRKCVQLGARWVKGLALRAAEVRCSGVLGWQCSRKHAQERAWARQGVRRVTVEAPHRFQPKEVPAERASHCLYVSHSLLLFPHFLGLFLFLLSYTLHYPSPPPPPPPPPSPTPRGSVLRITQILH